METLKHILRGCGELPICGEHPGTGALLLFTFGGFLAGVQRGLFHGLLGALIMLLFFGPMYLYGAYSRSVYETRAQAQRRSE